jgi:hypothetical protein
MTCRDTKDLLELERRGGPSRRGAAFMLHLAACHRCGETAKIAGLSSVLLGSMREVIVPGPSFYPRLRS